MGATMFYKLYKWHILNFFRVQSTALRTLDLLEFLWPQRKNCFEEKRWPPVCISGAFHVHNLPQYIVGLLECMNKNHLCMRPPSNTCTLPQKEQDGLTPIKYRLILFSRLSKKYCRLFQGTSRRMLLIPNTSHYGFAVEKLLELSIRMFCWDCLQVLKQSRDRYNI